MQLTLYSNPWSSYFYALCQHLSASLACVPDPAEELTSLPGTDTLHPLSVLRPRLSVI